MRTAQNLARWGGLSIIAACLAACQPKQPPAAQPGSTAPPVAAPEKKEEPSRAASALKAGAPYEVVEIQNPGALQVTAVFTGDPIPPADEIPVNIDVPFCGHKVYAEHLLVDKATRGVRNVVVRLEGIQKGKAPPQEVKVVNRNCSFDPHVAVAVRGTKIAVENADPVLHTTHPYLAGSSFFNLPLPAGEPPPSPRPIPRTGLMEVACDVHKWMRSYVYVHTNPYLAVSDLNGKLKIEGIPPGKYPYVAWHETLKELKGEIEIVAGQTAELKLEFSPPK